MMRQWFRPFSHIKACFQSYDRLQRLVVLLLYFQIACAFIGSLGAIYTSVLVVHVALSLFALVAIESASQNLGRTYAALLACAVILDIAWFTLFTFEIRFASQDTSIEEFSAFSLKLVLWMQIFGFAARVLSSILWVKMYCLGASSGAEALYQPINLEERARSVDFSPDASPGHPRENSLNDEVLAGSIYNPTYYASLFQPSQGLYSELKIDDDGGSSDGVSSPFMIHVVRWWIPTHFRCGHLKGLGILPFPGPSGCTWLGNQSCSKQTSTWVPGCVLPKFQCIICVLICYPNSCSYIFSLF